MTYLIAEIFVYLLAALVLGLGAGWLWRDQQAGRQAAAAAESDAQVALREANLQAALQQAETGAAAQAAEAASRQTRLQAAMAAMTLKLAGVEHRVVELQRERELQNRALQVLHQQLELAVERRTPGSSNGTTG